MTATRIRLNETLSLSIANLALSDYYKYFRPLIDKAFAEPFINPHLYIPVPSADEALQETVEPTHSYIQFLIGYTGSGKSSSIRHAFAVPYDRISRVDVQNHRAAFIVAFNEAAFPQLHTLLLELREHISKGQAREADEVLDRAERAIQQYIASVLAQFADTILERHKKDVAPADILEYIREIDRTSLLKEPGCSPSDDLTALSSFSSRDWFRYELIRLKLATRVCGLLSLTLAVDDIEPLDYNIQKTFIKLFVTIYGCFVRTEVTRLNMVCLVSCRPPTYDFIVKDKLLDFRQQEAEPIFTSLPPPLERIVLERFEYLLKHDLKCRELQTRVDWDNFYPILELGITTMVRKHGLFIQSCANYNIRAALVELKRVLCSRKFFQKDAEVDPAFDIEDQVRKHGYTFSPAHIIRCIAVGGREFYQSRPDCCIANLFANTYDPELDLLHPYIIYFAQQENLRRLNMRKVFSAEEMNSFFHELGWVRFAAESKGALEFLHSAALLEVVVSDAGAINYGIMPRATMLWTHLHENSFLVSLYRDDCYAAHGDGRDSITSRLPFGEKQFLAFLDFVNFISQREQALLMSLRSDLAKQRRYKQFFGPRVICHRLNEGLGKSAHMIFGNNIPDQVRRYSEEVSARIRAVQQLADPAQFQT